MRGRSSFAYLLLAILLLSGAETAALATETEPATVAAFPGNDRGPGSPLLVDAAWLERRIADAAARPLVILDVSKRRTYRRGHVPGAVHGYWQDTMDPYYPVYGAVLSDRNVVGARAELLGRWNIGSDTDVVVYGEHANRYAAHVIWFLRYLGHERASMLDGGLAAWRAFGGEVTDDDGSLPNVESIMNPTPQAGFIIGTRELSQRIDDPSIVIVDTRTPGQRDDTLNESLATGHIPGAVLLPWSDLIRDRYGRLRPPGELRQLFTDAGITPDQEIIIYGFFGVETGLAWLALELLDYPSVRVYDQGWAEWASKPELPIEASLAPLGSAAPAND